MAEAVEKASRARGSRKSVGSKLKRKSAIATTPETTGLAALAVAAEAAVAPAEPIAAAAAPTKNIDLTEAATSPALPSDTIPAEAIAPATEGQEDMATIAPTDTVGINSEKLQAMFGDVGTRFKASFEKSSKLGEEMVELTKGNVEAVVASARVAAKGSEALGQDAAEYGKKSLETAVAAMKSFASVKSPTELFQLQSDYARTAFDTAVAEASKFSESMMKLAGDVAQPLSTRYAVAAEKIKAVAL